ncbi:MAG TPA: hypothetical protein VIJ28_19005 [Chloroflexota bacterium]|jgi:HPt (histidine-containing phosphotransfer) domain-containing protein
MSQAVLDQLKQLATQLSRAERARLAEWLAAPEDDQSAGSSLRHVHSLYGACADLGSVPSDADIDDVRRDMWDDFPRRDLT